jgi:hypothetical protein
MKKLFLLIALGLLLPLGVWAQAAKIIEAEGDVSFRKAAGSAYEKAKPGLYLKSNAEVKTGANSQCTIAFDEGLKNILTIKENSTIAIEELRPAKVFMPRGKVFSLIEDLPELGKFEVRTPTAIAGVRGTGDSIETDGSNSGIKCFEGGLRVQGRNRRGRNTGSKDLFAGSGLWVSGDGALGDIFDLLAGDYKEWGDFKDMIAALRSRRGGRGDSGSHDDPFDIIGDLDDEYRDDITDDFFEDLRRELEDDQPEPYEPNGNGIGYE